MEMQPLADNVYCVDMLSKQTITEILKELTEIVSAKNENDIILDFGGIDVVLSSDISNLLILKDWVEGSGQKLILSNAHVTVKCILDVAGLLNAFKFAKTKKLAMEMLK